MEMPRIGILCARTYLPARIGTVPAVVLNDAYRKAVCDAGGAPLLIPVNENAEDAAALCTLCDGLLLPGGVDVDPAFYAQEPHVLLGEVDAAADRAAFAAVRCALEKQIPILGICRGMQLVNVALGGSLYQDLSCFGSPVLQHQQKAERIRPSHTVSFSPGSRMAGLFGEQLRVNSMHHQCVDRPGKGLLISGKAPDGIPEAMETADGRVMLVQWHPEELRHSQPVMNTLFSQFIRQAAD